MCTGTGGGGSGGSGGGGSSAGAGAGTGSRPWLTHHAGTPPEGVQYYPDAMPDQIKSDLLKMLRTAPIRVQGYRNTPPQGYKQTSHLVRREKAPKVMYYFRNADGTRPSGYDFNQAVEEYLFEKPAPPALVAYRDWLQKEYGIPDHLLPNAFIGIRNDKGKQTFAPSHSDEDDEWVDGTGFINGVLCDGDEECPRLFEITSTKNDRAGKDVIWGEYLGHGSITYVSQKANKETFHRVIERGNGELNGARYSLVGRTLAAYVQEGEAKKINYLTTNAEEFGYPTDTVKMVIVKKDGSSFHVADKANQREKEMKFQQLVLSAVENKDTEELEDAFKWGEDNGAYKAIKKEYWRLKICGAGAGTGK